MENMSVLSWMSRQGWAQLYLSAQVANPTSGAGAILFSATAPKDLFMLKFTVFNGATITMEYAVQVYNTGTSVWDDMGRWTVDCKTSSQFSTHFPVNNGQQIRLAIVAAAGATGVSLAGVEYLQGA